MNFLKKNKIYIIVLIGVLLIFLPIYFNFGSLSIEATPEDSKITLNGEVIKNKKSKILRTGDYTIEIKKNNYNSIKKKIEVKPGTNKYNFTLESKKNSFLEKLPLMEPDFTLTYDKNGNLFSVMITSENIEETKKKVLALMKKHGLDPAAEKIIFDAPAIFDNKPGP